MSALDGPAPAPGYRFVPCSGEAHHPAAGGHVDYCALCQASGRWGEVLRLAPETVRAIARGEKRGGAASARELARVVDGVLDAVHGARSMREIMALLQLALKDYTP